MEEWDDLEDLEREEFLSDQLYEDDGFRFNFEDMKKNGYKAYWISLKLRTPKQKAVFRFVFDHPRCVLGDLKAALSIQKDTLLPILRGLDERGLLIIEDSPNRGPRLYSINRAPVEELLECYKQRIYRMFPDVKERCEREARLALIKRKREAKRAYEIAKELEKFENQKNTEDNVETLSED
ncbi:MAG: hypothetical protein E7388_05775 [Ruminococcaceae bacterium]|nr:hypothetical protein [Oscillospiraceae bacterium]